MNVRFSPTTKIQACCDPSATRYALGAVLLSPAPDNQVWLTSCDGKALAATKVAGQAECAVLVPVDAFGTSGKRTDVPNIARDNGHWVSRKRQIVEAQDAGRFPRATDCLPDYEGRDIRVLSIDAKLLLNLAHALSGSGKHDRDPNSVVTLIIDVTPDEKNGNLIANGMGAVGTDGVGVLMPFAGNGRTNNPQVASNHVKAYSDRRADYIAEFKNVEPPKE